MSHTYYRNHWTNTDIMVLYEGEKRVVRGYNKAEVCWICVDEYGKLSSIPARHLRQMDCKCGFAFVDGVWEQMEELLTWAANKYGEDKR